MNIKRSKGNPKFYLLHLSFLIQAGAFSLVVKQLQSVGCPTFGGPAALMNMSLSSNEAPALRAPEPEAAENDGSVVQHAAVPAVLQTKQEKYVCQLNMLRRRRMLAQ